MNQRTLFGGLIFAAFVIMGSGKILPTAVAATILKIATVAPEGTVWASNLEAIRAEVEQKTKGRVKFTVYYGGVVGDEVDALRKIRIGQLHGGIFTGKTLGEIFSDTRVMEVPFNFGENRKKALRVLKELTPYFTKGFRVKGFEALGFLPVGKVYLVATKKLTNLKELKGVKIWSWEGDRLASLFAEEMKIISIPLALPEVLGAFSTGIVEAAYASPAAMLALQWNSKIKYMIDLPITYSVAGFFLSLRGWNKISAKDRKIVKEVIESKLPKIIRETERENDQAIKALKVIGVEFIQFPPGDLKELNKTNTLLFHKLQEKGILSSTIIQKFKRAMAK